MPLEQTKSDRTRQFIIESTAEIFNKKGYAGTSLTDLTTATSLTKGSIYGNFGGKEEVALAAFDYNWDRVSSRIMRQINATETIKEKLMVYTIIYRTTAKESFSRGGCPLLNTAVEADDTNPILKDRASKAIAGWKKNIVSLVKQGIDAGEIRASVDPHKTALSMIAMIEGGIMISKVTGQLKNLTDVLDTLADYIEGLFN